MHEPHCIPGGGVPQIGASGYSRDINNAGQETEIKIRVNGAKFAAALLASKGFAIQQARHHEMNVVLDTFEQTMRSRGELLRIRTADGHTIVTYKGPTQLGAHRTREEIEFRTGDADAAWQLFDRLGYRAQFRYEKYRTVYHRLGDPGVVTLDETPIGDFLEIEGPAAWIDSTAAKLGFGREQYVLDSYGRLYLAWCQAHGVPPSHMIFPAG